MIYRQFKIDRKYLTTLSENEKKLLPLLESTVKEISRLYDSQIKEGFYPKGMTKLEIESAAKKNPAVLSPFTMVKKIDGKLICTPYHKRYKKQLLPIAALVQEAAELCANPSFKRYLTLRAAALLSGAYKQADIAWFDVKNSHLDFVIGPFERYLDTMFLQKRAYQAHVAIIDQEKTLQASQTKEILYSSANLSYAKKHSTDVPQKGVNLLIEQTTASSGYVADAVFSGEHFPCDLDLMKKYGSKIIIFYPQMKLKFEKLHYPIFKILFEKNFALKYSKKLLLSATEYNILLYELGRQLHKYPGTRERLQELYAPIDEANGFVSGISHAKQLALKGFISQEKLEAIIIIHIVWMFADWMMNKDSGELESYVTGDAVALNAYVKNGALKEIGGTIWLNFSKIFDEIEKLADILVKMLIEGKYSEVKLFIKNNLNVDNFTKLGRNLIKINPKF